MCRGVSRQPLGWSRTGALSWDNGVVWFRLPYLRRPVAAIVAAAGVTIVSAAGCSSGHPPPRQLDPQHADVTAPANAKLEVQAGPEDPGAGGQWQLGAITPTGAVAAVDKRTRSSGNCPAEVSGCAEGDVYFAVILAADIPTGTTVRFKVENCRRGSCPTAGGELVGDDALVAYTVTITP